MKVSKIAILISAIVVVIVIWFFNIRFIRIISSMKGRIEPVQDTSLFTVEAPAKSNFEFKPIKRDPFNVVIDTGPKEAAMPAFSLQGVVLTNDGALALMELANGNVYTMKQGEEYLGVKIKKITPKEVIVEFRGRKVTFGIWE